MCRKPRLKLYYTMCTRGTETRPGPDLPHAERCLDLKFMQKLQPHGSQIRDSRFVAPIVSANQRCAHGVATQTLRCIARAM